MGRPIASTFTLPHRHIAIVSILTTSRSETIGEAKRILLYSMHNPKSENSLANSRCRQAFERSGLADHLERRRDHTWRGVEGIDDIGTARTPVAEINASLPLCRCGRTRRMGK